MKISGGCHCGKVRFEIKGRPSSVCTCYCHTCQKVSGSISTTAANFLQSDFLLVQGILKHYHSSPKVVRSFCEDCGTHINYLNTDYPDNIEIFVGSLDNPSEFPTEAHTWISHKSNWVTICDALPQHEQD